MKNRLKFIGLLLINLIFVVSCEKDNTDNPENVNDLGINKTEINLKSGEITTVNILLGSGNYTVEVDNDKVQATLNGNTITIEALAEGKSKVTVADTETDKKSVLNITIEKGENSPIQKITLTTDEKIIWLHLVAAEEDKPYVWIDFNKNGVKDENETVKSFDGRTEYRIDVDTITIYGNITRFGCKDSQIKSLDVSGNTLLESLVCSGTNNLTSLDLTKNTELDFLNCSGNKLTKLDISKNTKLTEVICYRNQLSELDLSKNPELKKVECLENNLTELDLSNNPKLIGLYCNDNILTSLNITKNTNLIYLHCFKNKLTSLDISNNKKLVILNCPNNRIQALDLSNNTMLQEFHCHHNEISSLDVSMIENLNVFWCFDNPLMCITVSQEQLDDIPPYDWKKDDIDPEIIRTYSTNCN